MKILLKNNRIRIMKEAVSDVRELYSMIDDVHSTLEQRIRQLQQIKRLLQDNEIDQSKLGSIEDQLNTLSNSVIDTAGDFSRAIRNIKKTVGEV